MNKKLYIKNYCTIRNNQLKLNGKIIFEGEKEQDLRSFLKNTYKNEGIRYPKFFKMDNLSKLAFLAAEVLLKDIDKTALNNNIAIVFSNNAASLDTDRKYQESINDPENYYPSPAVFVYTLPNIGIGEISIRHQLKSENAFFVFQKFDTGFHRNYEAELIREGSDAVLGGWVNVDGSAYDVFMYLVTKNGSAEHTKENLLKLYKE